MEARSREPKMQDKVLGQSWTPYLLNFNFLPSTTLHASWNEQFVQENILKAVSGSSEIHPYLHRHWSDYLLQQSGLSNQPVLGPVNLPLQIAILPPPLFAKLVTISGIVLSNMRIRQTIMKSEVAALQKDLSDEMLKFTREKAARFFRGLENMQSLTISQIISQLDSLGGALFLHAFANTQPALIQRIAWRLPIESKERVATLNQGAPDLTPERALDLLGRLTSEVDKTWLSSFQKTH